MEVWNRPRFQLTVHKTRDVKARAKSGTHDVYVVVSFADEKHKTSLKEKCEDAEWNEDCFLKLLSTNEDVPVKIKLFCRNFFLHDELIGELKILLKHHKFYERPLTGWFSLKNKNDEEMGEILLTLAYHATTPVSTRPTLRRTNSFRFIANKFGKHIGSRKAPNLGVPLTQLSFHRNSDSSMVDFKVLSESFQDMNKLDSVELRRPHNLPQHRHTIDFSTMPYDLHAVADSFNSGNVLQSTPKARKILASDTSLQRFGSFDSLNDCKKPFDDSTSSVSLGTEDDISNVARDDLKFEEDSKKTDAFVAHLNDYSKQELVQLVIEQREWIKSREVYILDLHSYMNTLLLKILNSNCAILQKNSSVPDDECHRLTTFKTEEVSTARRWMNSIFGQKQKS